MQTNLNNIIGWDAKACQSRYKALERQRAHDRIKQLRADVFHNTVEIVGQGYYINSSGEKVSLRHGEDDREMRTPGIYYFKEIKLSPGEIPEYPEMDITVEDADCLKVAERLKSEGFNPAVLNMASRRNPGGGVVNGAGAQEETLFRRTDLFRSLYQYADFGRMYGVKRSLQSYPLEPNFGGIYTPKALLFREDADGGYALMDHPVELSFISVAAMNRPELISDEEIDPDLVPAIKNKIRTMLRMGIKHGHDSLVLGASGCGAFRNPPKHMARLFHEVFEEDEFDKAFSKVMFAIINDHNSGRSHNPQGNFLPFFREFGNKGNSSKK